VKDRLSWYYHNNDRQSLEQAAMVARRQQIDMGEIRRWSENEGKLAEFERIKNRLRRQ
jgi:hypothetical protein